jgi:hypothetical protein
LLRHLWLAGTFMTIIDVPAKQNYFFIFYFFYFFAETSRLPGTSMTVINVLAKKNWKNYFLFLFLFFWSDCLDPAYIRRVKRMGGCEKYCSSKYNALGQVHELLIRCLSMLHLDFRNTREHLFWNRGSIWLDPNFFYPSKRICLKHEWSIEKHQCPQKNWDVKD